MVHSHAVASRLKHVCDMLREIETILFSGDLSYETCDKSCLRRSYKICSVYGGLKGARRAEERKKKTKMTKLDFHRFQVRLFSNNFKCYCKWGNAREQI